MPINQSDKTIKFITYDVWKVNASNNKIRYVEYTTPSRYVAAFGKLEKVLYTEVNTSGSISDFETNFKPSASFANDEDELTELVDLDSKIGVSDGRQQKAYEFGSTVIYIGYSEFGTTTSGSGWTIKKVTLDALENPILETWTAVESAIWDNRTTEFYF
jgi:hypothetical protein